MCWAPNISAKSINLVKYSSSESTTCPMICKSDVDSFQYKNGVVSDDTNIPDWAIWLE